MVLHGKSAAPGAAAGRVYVHNNLNNVPKESFFPEGEEQSHLDRYNSVKEKAHAELETLMSSVQKHDPQRAKIFEAHKEIVDDIIINEEITAKITKERCCADWAIYQVYETVLAALCKTGDSLIAERASDFADVRALILRLWLGSKNESLSSLSQPCIIAARELMPSDIASIDKNKALAILTETGGVTSHAAIIAKSYGIPAVMGIQGLLDAVRTGQYAAVDADKGFVFLDPDKKTTAEYVKKAASFQMDKKEAEAWLSKEGRTACGEKIDIGLNIANADKDLQAQQYADSVGVFRTEFLYMGRKDLPGEDEQFDVYRKVLECFGERPVILRTLDIGGDKQLSCMEMPREENPFLGVRALRFCFNHPDIFKTQLKAALRASVYGNLYLMLPMVTSLDDIRRAKEHIAGAKEELEKEGKTVSPFKTGIMIEIPSIALIADRAVDEVDFASIGTNDLCQYLCAADRMNSAAGNYYQNFSPAMLRLITETSDSFSRVGKPLSICGEMGGDAAAVPLLIGLGLRKLSMNASSVAAVKRAVAAVTVKQCEELAAKALECGTEDEVRSLLTGDIDS